MTKKLDLDCLKSEYIGKEFGWLTILDVYRDEISRRYFFKCKCRCGNEVCKQYNKVISGHTSSCGCYKFSKEYSDSLSEYWQTNPDKVKAKTDKYSQWCKENPNKVKERGKKHSQFYKDNPDTAKRASEKRKVTFENNPAIQETINKKNRQCWTDEKRSAFSDKMKNLYIEHPEIGDKISDSLVKLYEDNPDRKIEISDRNKAWSKDHHEELVEHGRHHSELLKERRLLSIENSSDEINTLLSLIHPSMVDKFLNGDIRVSDDILIKCSVCGEYMSRTLNNVWRFSEGKFRSRSLPICEDCLSHQFSSSYENDIVNIVSEFYTGECIRNSRKIVPPLELDMYYPEKKIAIEFNGDYFHNINCKSNDYHFKKFKICYDHRIILVSIFEYYWNSSKDSIILYLKDLFSNTSNSLSYTSNSINLNYPPPDLNLAGLHVNYSSYISRGNIVFTCGNAFMDELQFLIDTAKENNLDYFTNDNGDLEIRDKNICFHLADILNGDIDAYDRWKEYHDNNIRCVFIYPAYLSNPNRVNVYKNILLYHCGLAKRVYARNTVIQKYPSVKMKKFFEENNIEGYRNAKTAYVLEDKITHEPYMCYLVGHSYFGNGNYDCEIARGACKLGIQVIGGASKLWKHIIQDNPDIKSIVYYCDRREYDQRSIGHLMDSVAMQGLGHVYTLMGGKSFMNYWVNDVYIDDKLWHRSGDYKNREPAKHKLVMEAVHKGDCVPVYNPGSFVNIFVRAGYHLDGMKVVSD